jgi:hypothetical protein
MLQQRHGQSRLLIKLELRAIFLRTATCERRRDTTIEHAGSRPAALMRYCSQEFGKSEVVNVFSFGETHAIAVAQWL